MAENTPGSWLCAALDVLRDRNPKFPYKVLGVAFNDTLPRSQTVRVLNTNDGSVWVFTCHVERGPA